MELRERVTTRNGGRFLTSWATRILPLISRASQQRPGKDTRILSALSELKASIRFGTRSHISDRIFRRPTKYFSAESNHLGCSGKRSTCYHLIDVRGTWLPIYEEPKLREQKKSQPWKSELSSMNPPMICRLPIREIILLMVGL